MKKQLGLSMLLVILAATFSLAQISLDSSQTAIMSTLRQRFDNTLSVQWSKEKGTPSIITFQKPHSFSSDPRISATTLLSEIMGLNKANVAKDKLQLVKTQFTKGNQYFSFEQKYKGIPVKGGEYVVTVSDNGKIQLALGNFFPSIDVEVMLESR